MAEQPQQQQLPPPQQQMVPPVAQFQHGGGPMMQKRECSCISDLISCACNCGGFGGMNESEMIVLDFSENNSNLRESLDRLKEAKIERQIRRGEARGVVVAANAPAIAAVDAPAPAIAEDAAAPAPAPAIAEDAAANNNYLPPPGYVLVPAGGGGMVCEVFNEENANGCVIM